MSNVWELIVYRCQRLRYKLFSTSTLKSCADLPPTRDALVQHVYRSNFQAYLWKHCLERGVVPSPEEHGWETRNSNLTITWMTRPAAPSALLELMRCECSSGCSTATCRCFKNSLPCTDACQCQDCSKVTTAEPASSCPVGDILDEGT